MGLRPFTLPNLLTVGRLATLPFLIAAILSGRHAVALIIFLVASITDIVDGYLARHFGMASQLGAYLDPIADKLFLVSTFVVFALPGTPSKIRIPLWLLVILIVRDVALLIAGLVMLLAMKVRQFPPSPLGKAATFFEISTIVAIFLANIDLMSPVVAHVGFGVVAVCVLTSGAHYVWRAKWLPREEAGSES
jgi:cardiolipin synthase (CMP-forming)